MKILSKSDLESRPASSSGSESSRRTVGRVVAYFGVMFPLVMGLVVLVGWIFDLPQLTTIVPGFTAMKPNSAAGFLLAALALALLLRETKPRIVVGKILALLVFALGLVTMAQYIFGSDFRIDTLLVGVSSAEPSNPFPARMSALASFCFLTMGVGLFFLTGRQRSTRAISQVAILAPMLTALLGLMGYAFGASAFYQFGGYSSMAIHTALAFLALGCGMLAARPERGLVSLLTHATSGSLMARRLLPAALTIPLVLGWLRVRGEQAGYFELPMGTALFAASLMVIFVALIWRTAVSLDRGDLARQRMENALRESEVAKTAILASALDCIIAMDRQGRVIEWNPAAEKTFGYPRAEAIGTLLADLIIPERFREAHWRGLARSLESGEGPLLGKRFEMPALHPDGSEFPVELSIVVSRGNDLFFTAYLRDITERLQTEQRLAKRARLLDLTNDAVVVHDTAAHITFWNQGAVNLYGWTSEEAFGKDLHSLLQTEFPKPVGEIRAELQREGKFTGEVVQVARDGRRIQSLGRWVLDRKTDSLLTSYTDISALKGAEEALRESAQRLQITTHAARIGLWEWNVVTDQVRWDAQMFRLYGMPTTSDYVVPYSRWCDSVLPEDLAGQEALLQDRVRTHVGGPRSFRIRRVSDGAVRHIEAVDAVRTNIAGATEWVLGTNMDVTERKEAEETLRASEARFRAAVSAVSSLIWTSNARGEMEGEQPGWGNFTGQTYQEYQGSGWATAVHPEDAQATIGEWNQAVAEKRMCEFEHRLRRHDGEWRLCSVRAVPVLDDAGKIREWVGVHTDITERRKAEDALRESEDNFRAMGENIAQLVWMADDKGWIFWYNQRWYESTGTTPEEMQGWGWEKVHDPGELQRMLPGWKHALATGEPWEDIFPLRQKDGQYGWFLSRAFPLRDRAGNITRWFGTNTDITELRETQEELKKAREDLQRHAASLELTVIERTVKLREIIGELEAFSYSLSHDMRAPLRAIHGFTQLALDECGEKAGPFLSKVISAAGRLDRMIQEVLSYTRISRQEIRSERLDVDWLVHNIISERPELQPPHAEVIVKGPLLPMQGHEASLTQCLTNLLGNAVKFVARDVQPHVVVSSELRDDAVRLWIEDNGIGIEPAAQEKLFEMFYRINSEKDYEGTGLGLAIVRKAVQRMGGTVGVESEVGRGSRFWVQLPKGD